MSDNQELNDLLGPETASVSTPGLRAVAPPVSRAAMAGGVAYDGSEVNKQLALWRPSLKSADADLLPEKRALDSRSRDSMRNDAFVAGGATLHKDNIVGSRFALNAKPETKVLFGKDDPVWEAEFQEEVETKFTLFAESDQNWIDAARTNTLTGQVRLSVGVYAAGGEVLALAKWMPNDGRSFRTAVQLIDTDRLSTPWDKQGQPNIRNGVERDENGAPIAYYIRRTHPSEVPVGIRPRESDEWVRIPARKPWGRQVVMHTFEQLRVDQSRGVSSIVTALTEMQMFKAFRRVELERAVVASTYAASIESDLPPGDVYAAMGANHDTSLDWVKSYMDAINEYSGGAKNLHIDGVKIPVFMPGTHLKIQSPGAQSPMGDAFEQSLLRNIAAALDVSYEQLSRDYTKTNYSSARAAMGETWKAMLSRKKMVADKTANFSYRLWMEEAVNYGSLETLKRANIPNFYDGLNAEAYTACEWIGAGQGQIDPMKETQASVLKIQNGLSTKEIEIAKMSGGDWRKVAKQIQRERELDSQLGNPSVYDAMKPQIQGSSNAATNQDNAA